MSMCACMYKCTHECVYVHVCKHEYQVYSHITVHILTMSSNIYDYHIVNVSHTAIMVNAHIDPTFFHTSAKTQST